MKRLILLLIVLGTISCKKEILCDTIPTTVTITSDRLENIQIESSIDITPKINNGTIRIDTETNSWLFIHNKGSKDITVTIKDRDFIITSLGSLSYPVSCYYGY